jgi:hypothetical protein
MATASLWEERMATLANEERLAATAFHGRVKAATEQFAMKRATLDERRGDLERMREDPIVITKTLGSGPPSRVFHAKDVSCGWKPTSRRELLLSEAQAEGLRLCSSYPCWGALHAAMESRRQPRK